MCTIITIKKIMPSYRYITNSGNITKNKQKGARQLLNTKTAPKFRYMDATVFGVKEVGVSDLINSTLIDTNVVWDVKR